jgi:hypothetical protein
MQKASNGINVKHLSKYLLGTQDKGIILRPTALMELTCYVDADFCVTWDKKHSEKDPDMACPRINIIYHHYRSELFNDRVKIQPIKSMENIADILTKQQPTSFFVKS